VDDSDFPDGLKPVTERGRAPAFRASRKVFAELIALNGGLLGLSYRDISEAPRVGKTSVGEFVRRAEVIGITTWPLPEGLDDGELAFAGV
jgi:hypothetical protein